MRYLLAVTPRVIPPCHISDTKTEAYT